MNIGSIGIVAGMAAQVAQSRATEVDRVQQENTVQEREVESAHEAEQAEGVGLTQEESAAGDRDADGRLAWQFGNQTPTEPATPASSALSAETPHHAKDPSGQAGTQLDLEG